VRLATPAECVSVFGYPPGSMPPFGHRRECVTLLDRRVRDFAGEVFPGAGAPHLMFRCLPAVLERAAAATTLSIAQVSAADAAAGLAERAAAAMAAREAAAAARGRAGEVVGEAEGAPAAAAAAGGLGGAAAAVAAASAANDGTLVVWDTADDITYPLEPSSPGESRRFVADGALGRLARWLRCLGVDAEHVPAGAAGQYGQGVPNAAPQFVGSSPPHRMSSILTHEGRKREKRFRICDGLYLPGPENGNLLALAARDGRVILTRDRQLLRRREVVGAYLVEDDDPRQQLAQVSAKLSPTSRRNGTDILSH